MGFPLTPPTGPASTPPSGPPSSQPSTSESVVLTTAVTPRRRRSRSALLAVGGVVVIGGAAALALVVLGGGGDGGAETPEAAVEGIVDALDQGDLIGALTLVAPDETGGIVELVEAVSGRVGDLGLGEMMAGEDGVDPTVDVALEITSIGTEELAEGVSRVTVAIEGDATVLEDESLLGSSVGDESLAIDEFEIGMIVVDVDGWYVSPMLTIADLIHAELEDGGLDVGRPDWDRVADIEPVDAAESPAEAVEAMLDAVADFDVEALADTMTAGPARTALVFSDMFDVLLDELDDTVGIDLDQVDVTELDDGRVGVDEVTFELEVTDTFDESTDRADVRIEDDCVTLENDNGSNTGCALRNVPLSSDLEDEQIVLHTTERGGAVVVDPVQTVMSLAANVVPRLNDGAVLDVFDTIRLELFDDATAFTAGTVVDVPLDGRTFSVFELSEPGEDGVAIATDDEQTSYDYSVRRDGEWTDTYLSDGVIEGSGGADAVRVRVSTNCSGWDERALLVRCERPDDAAGRFVVGSVERSPIEVPGIVTGSLEPGSAVVHEFSVSERTGIEWAQDTDAEVRLEGSYSESDGTTVLEPGDFTLTVWNDDFAATPYSIEVTEVELRAELLTRENPTGEVTVGGDPIVLTLEAGDQVLLQATPSGDQDIMLSVEGVADCQDRDLWLGGDAESCRFTVETSGDYDVFVDGYTEADVFGTATVSAAWRPPAGNGGGGGELAGMKGTTPRAYDVTDWIAGVDEFWVGEGNPALLDDNYVAESYDSVVLIALAVAAAGTDGSAHAAEIVGVSGDGERCTTYASCLAIIEAGGDPDYDGVSGPQDYNGNGEPLAGQYAVLIFGEDNRIDDSQETVRLVGTPPAAVQPLVPVTVDRAGDGVLTIGSVLPDTGSLSFLGPGMYAGVEYAIAEINAAGGVLGQPVEYVRGDSGDTTTDTASQTVERLLGEEVDAIVGPASSGVSLTVIDRVVGAGVTMFSPSSTSPALIDYADEGLFFRASPPDTLQGALVAQLMAEDGATSAYILNIDDMYGNGIAGAASATLADLGVQVVGSAAYDPASGDFDALVDDVVRSGADAVLLVSFDEGSLILRSAVDRGIGPTSDTRWYGVDGNMGNALGENFDAGS